jgi:hypothetical protein
MSVELFQTIIEKYKGDWMIENESKTSISFINKGKTYRNELEYESKLTSFLKEKLNSENLYVGKLAISDVETGELDDPVEYHMICEVEKNKFFRIDYVPEKNFVYYGHKNTGSFHFRGRVEKGVSELERKTKDDELVWFFIEMINELPEYRLLKITGS